MEKTYSEKIKKFLLAGFVTVCVALIFSIWFSALSDKGVKSPYFYREEPTLSASFYITQTAIAESVLSGAGTIIPEKRHHEETETPVPAPTLIFTPEADN